MKKSICSTFLLIAWMTTFGVGSAGALGPAPTAGADVQLSQKIKDCNRILQEFLSATDTIPPDVIRDAKAVIVFSDAVRAGFLVTGEFAKGVALAKDHAGSWSPAAFFRMSGVGVGLQIGGDVSDVVFVIRDEAGLNQLLENHFTMGADASAAAGTAGRQVKAETNSKTGILAYGRSKGLFAGISLDGAVIKQDVGANEKYYGKPLDARDILIGRKAPMTLESGALAATLRSHV